MGPRGLQAARSLPLRPPPSFTTFACHMFMPQYNEKLKKSSHLRVYNFCSQDRAPSRFVDTLAVSEVLAARWSNFALFPVLNSTDPQALYYNYRQNSFFPAICSQICTLLRQCTRCRQETAGKQTPRQSEWTAASRVAECNYSTNSLSSHLCVFFSYRQVDISRPTV